MKTLFGIVAVAMIAAADPPKPATPPKPKRVTTDLCDVMIGGGSTVSLSLVEDGQRKYPELGMVDKNAIRVVSGWLTLDQAKQLRDCLDEAISKSNVK